MKTMKVGNGLFQFTVYSPSPKEIRTGGLGRNQNRSHGRTMLTDLLFVDCFACFLIQPRMGPRSGFVHSGLHPTTSVINQNNDLQTYLSIAQ